MQISTKAIFLGIALSISLSSCATSPTTPSVGASNSPTASAPPMSPTPNTPATNNPATPQNNTLKLMIQGDAALQGFVVKQAQQICLNDLRTLDVELNLPTALEPEAQAILEAQGVIFKDTKNLSFSFAVADVQSLIAGFSKTLPGLSSGTITATTHLKNGVGNTMGSLTYAIVFANSNKDVQVLLKPAEAAASGATCSALITEITGAELKTTAGGILATVAPSPSASATPTPNPTPTANASVPVASIKMNVDSRFLNKEGETKQLTATLFDAAGNVLPADNVSLIWQSARPQDISVDNQGNLKAVVGLGYAPVTVTVAGTNISDTVAFDVSDPSFFSSPSTPRTISTPTPTPTPNIITSSIAFLPDIAMDSGGNFVVTWSKFEITSEIPAETDDENSNENNNSEPSFRLDIRGQRYNANGSKRGNEFVVSSDTSTSQFNISPSVAMDSDGDFVVAWSGGSGEQSKYEDIHIQRYNNRGNKQGSEILIEASTGQAMAQPAVAMDADGDFVVSWAQQSEQQSSSSTVQFQRYNQNGIPQGGITPVSNTPDEPQLNPAIGINDSGRFAISWISGSGSTYNIYAQTYAMDGTALSQDTQVNTAAFQGSNQNPFVNRSQSSIAMDNAGNFVVSWANGSQNTSTVLAQRFDNSTQKQGPELVINNNTTAFASFADVAMDSDGDFVVSWSEGSSEGKYSLDNEINVLAKRYNNVGDFQEEIVGIDNQLLANLPVVAIDDDGDVAFAWQGREDENIESEKYSIYTRRYKLNIPQQDR